MAASRNRTAEVHLSEATITRLPLYLRALACYDDADTISSKVLADAAGVNSAQVRKDLSHLGSHGVRGVGYEVGRLRDLIGVHTGSQQVWPIAIVGMGNLGQALVKHTGHRARAFEVVATFDVDPGIVGQSVLVGGELVDVQPVNRLPATVARTGAMIAVIATPPGPAQEVCDLVVGAGITSILNFSAAPLITDVGVHVRHVDLAQELHVLAYHEQQARTPSLLTEVSVL